jgi:hypothetical protein
MLIFLAVFAATVALAAMAENIAKLRCWDVYGRAFTSSRSSNPLKKT